MTRRTTFAVGRIAARVVSREEAARLDLLAAAHAAGVVLHRIGDLYAADLPDRRTPPMPALRLLDVLLPLSLDR